MGDNEHRGVSFECLSLKQSEEVDIRIGGMKAQVEETMMQWQKEMAVERGKWQKESEIMFSKIKTLEEDKIRNNALWAKNENRIRELEKIQTELQEIVENNLKKSRSWHKRLLIERSMKWSQLIWTLKIMRKRLNRKRKILSLGNIMSPLIIMLAKNLLGLWGRKWLKYMEVGSWIKKGRKKMLKSREVLETKGRKTRN